MLSPLVWPGYSPASTLSYVPCTNGSLFSCTSLTVPLARSGLAPGTISLSVQRRASSGGPTRSAVVALAGGPGQPALPLSEFIAQAVAPALSSRDLLVFDQRGTGQSDPLSCPAFETPSRTSASQLFATCASQIGPARGAFTTQESVQDIEALRRAGGYEKLVLYGTSYGTKVALEYAQRYPQNVEALVLDSVVPAEGPEPFAIPTFQAIPGVLDELCQARACAAIGANPVSEVATLAARLHTRLLSGSVYDGSGHRHASTLDETGLLQILEAGDLNPALRALLPAAVRSALHSNPDPLLRLHLLSEGLIPSIPVENTTTERSQEIDEPLFVDTTCEESPFPWQRTATAATRLAEADSFLASQSPADFYPFDATTAFNNSLVADCASWPDASAAPAAPAALPDVPTLILSGEQDLRTPTSNALRVAAQIPDAQLLVVPFTGHSVIGSDLSNCAAAAVAAFFSSSPVQQCTPGPDRFAPTPVTPTRLSAVHAPAGLPGKPGRTLVAVLDTLLDLNRQVVAATIQANQELPSGASFGGLHGGYARLTTSAAMLRSFSFVPGVQLTANFRVHSGVLQASSIHIGGSQAAAGTIRVGSSSQRVSGTLGGEHFDVSVAKVKLSSAGSAGSPSTAAVAALLGRRPDAPQPRGTLARLP
jgi:pimeloyl-ACP methyl ester carboxylesterase